MVFPSWWDLVWELLKSVGHALFVRPLEMAPPCAFCPQAEWMVDCHRDCVGFQNYLAQLEGPDRADGGATVGGQPPSGP